MKIAGLLAEYNPFHRGHAYQLATLRQDLEPDVLIVLMSGNVVQRGEFALLDKWTRARLALEAGADLVLELPLTASLQSADFFAEVGIKLLADLGCQDLVFGTESASLEELQAYVVWLLDHQSAIDREVQRHLKAGQAYPSAMGQALDTLCPPHLRTFDLHQANHLLAVQYLKVNAGLTHPMQAHAIQRQTGSNFLSGSQIRQIWYQDPQAQSLKEALPPSTYQALHQEATVRWEDYWPYLRYQILVSSPQSLADLHHVVEGIEHKVTKEAKIAETFADFLDRMTSRRWTRSAVQRLCLSLLLKIRDQEWQTYQNLMRDKPALRVLGLSHSGQAYLRHRRSDESLVLFSNLTQALEPIYQLNLRADQIYALNPSVQVSDQITGRYPLRTDDY